MEARVWGGGAGQITEGKGDEGEELGVAGKGRSGKVLSLLQQLLSELGDGGELVSKMLASQGARAGASLEEAIVSQLLSLDDGTTLAQALVAAAGASAVGRGLPAPLLRLLSPLASGFEELYPLGQGGFGQVTAVRNRLDNRVMAVKRIPFRSRVPPWSPPEELEAQHARLLREVRAMAALDGSPHVVKYHWAWVEPRWERVAASMASMAGAPSLPPPAVAGESEGVDLPGGQGWGGRAGPAPWVLGIEAGGGGEDLSDGTGEDSSSGGGGDDDETTEMASAASADHSGVGGHGASRMRKGRLGAPRDASWGVWGPGLGGVWGPRCAMHPPLLLPGPGDELAEPPPPPVLHAPGCQITELEEDLVPATSNGLSGGAGKAEGTSTPGSIDTSRDGSTRGDTSSGGARRIGSDGDGGGGGSDEALGSGGRGWAGETSSGSGSGTGGGTSGGTSGGSGSGTSSGSGDDSGGSGTPPPPLPPLPRRWPYALHILMELVTGATLSAWLRRRECVRLEHAVLIMQQLARGVAFLHARRLIHRDLKPANIFLTMGEGGQPLVKVGDLGLAATLDPGLPRTGSGASSASGWGGGSASGSDGSGSAGASSSRTSGVGTAAYCAPEQLDGRAEYGGEADVFACGMILLELLSMWPTQMERVAAMSDARRGRLPPQLTRDHPHHARLIGAMLHPDPSRRPSAADLEAHPLLRLRLATGEEGAAPPRPAPVAVEEAAGARPPPSPAPPPPRADGVPKAAGGGEVAAEVEELRRQLRERDEELAAMRARLRLLEGQ